MTAATDAEPLLEKGPTDAAVQDRPNETDLRRNRSLPAAVRLNAASTAWQRARAARDHPAGALRRGWTQLNWSAVAEDLSRASGMARALRTRAPCRLKGPHMEAMNLLLVERNSDWSEWQTVSRLLGRVVLVLVQQSDESSKAFHRRITLRLARSNTPGLNRVILLRDKQGHLKPSAARDGLVRGLTAQAQHGLRIYPAVPDLSDESHSVARELLSSVNRE